MLLECLCALMLQSSGLAEPAPASEHVRTERSEIDAQTEAEEKDQGDEAAKPLSLPEVTVESARPPGRDDTADATHVSGERLRASARPSTLEAISQESGDVYVSGSGTGIHGIASGASGAIHIRGLGGSPNSQVLVVEDDVPDVMGIFGHPIPDAYVPFMIDDVRVVKGGDSTLYGSNALGGAILIKSRWLHDDGFELTNDAAYGSFDTLKESIGFLGRFDKLDVATSFHVLKTDGHRSGAGGMNLVAALGLRWRTDGNLSITLRNKTLHLKGEDPGPASHPNSNHWYNVWRDNVSLHLDYRHPRVDLKTIPYASIGVHRLYDGFRSFDTTFGGKTEADIHILDNLDLLLGLSGEWVDGIVENRIEQTSESVQLRSAYAFYNQLSYRPIKTLSFVLGTREHYSDTYGFSFLYKGGARWSFYKGLYIRSRITRNFRQPTLRELYLPFPVANPGLKPEYALNWDAGIGLDSSHVDVSLSVYRSSAENMIRYFGAWPSAEVVNIDRITIWGVEGRLALKAIGPLDLVATANWQGVGRYTRQNPSAKANLAATLSHDFGEHWISGGFSGEWVHGLYMANYSRDKIPDVAFVDLSLRYRYQPASGAFSIEPYLLVRNLLDLRYAYIEDYPMPGLNALGGIIVRI